jgi:ABC-type polysaccharide/polyol phosphate export permease
MEELGDLWRGRGVLAVLVMRDIADRYRQAVIGILWALRPLQTALMRKTIFPRAQPCAKRFEDRN